MPRVRRVYTGGFADATRELISAWHVYIVTGHHPPPLVQGRFLGVVGDAVGYAHIFFASWPAGNPIGAAALHKRATLRR